MIKEAGLEEVKLKEEGKEVLDWLPYHQRLATIRPITCFLCGKEGHIVKDCVFITSSHKEKEKNIDTVEKTKESEEEDERIIGIAIIKFDNRLDHSQNWFMENRATQHVWEIEITFLCMGSFKHNMISIGSLANKGYIFKWNLLDLDNKFNRKVIGLVIKVGKMHCIEWDKKSM